MVDEAALKTGPVDARYWAAQSEGRLNAALSRDTCPATGGPGAPTSSAIFANGVP
jgi:hypothetical protein